MNVGDFFRTVDRDTVIAELERQRPRYIERRAGHIEAWNEIVTLTPVATEYACHVGMRAGADGKRYFDVSGVTSGSDERLSIHGQLRKRLPHRHHANVASARWRCLSAATSTGAWRLSPMP